MELANKGKRLQDNANKNSQGEHIKNVQVFGCKNVDKVSKGSMLAQLQAWLQMPRLKARELRCDTGGRMVTRFVTMDSTFTIIIICTL